MLIAAAALLASTVAAIAGTGGSLILLPALTALLGVREAIPVFTVAQFIGNSSRVFFNRRELCLPVTGWFALGAVPLAALGAWLFTRIPDANLLRVLGAFLLCSVVVRRRRLRQPRTFKPAWFAAIGGVFSVVSAVTGTAGPFLVPFFLAHGLVKGAFVGTEALCAVVMHVVKLAGYQGFGVMSSSSWTAGLLLGPVMIAGSSLGKALVDRMPVAVFLRVVDLAVALVGIIFLLR